MRISGEKFSMPRPKAPTMARISLVGCHYLIAFADDGDHRGVTGTANSPLSHGDAVSPPAAPRLGNHRAIPSQRW